MSKFGSLIYTPEEAKGHVLEKAESHTPRLESPDVVKAGEEFEVVVRVGPHPNLVEHNIGRVELYFYEEERPFNPILLASATFTPVYAEPVVRFTIKLSKSGVLYAISYCNLHGLWEARKSIRVEK